MPPLLKLGYSVLVDLDDLTASIITAGAAGPVGELESAALGALDQSGGDQLPVASASLVASGLADFSLRDCHGDTSSCTAVLNSSICLIYIVQQLFQNSQSWIRFLFAPARPFVQVGAAPGAKPFAVFPAEELLIHAQDKGRFQQIVDIQLIPSSRK